MGRQMNSRQKAAKRDAKTHPESLKEAELNALGVDPSMPVTDSQAVPSSGSNPNTVPQPKSPEDVHSGLP